MQCRATLFLVAAAVWLSWQSVRKVSVWCNSSVLTWVRIPVAADVLGTIVDEKYPATPYL